MTEFKHYHIKFLDKSKEKLSPEEYDDVMHQTGFLKFTGGHFLDLFYPKNASWISIYFWVIKYSKIISNYTDNLKLKVGQEVQIDEIEFHRRKHPKKKLGIDKNGL